MAAQGEDAADEDALVDAAEEGAIEEEVVDALGIVVMDMDTATRTIPIQPLLPRPKMKERPRLPLTRGLDTRKRIAITQQQQRQKITRRRRRIPSRIQKLMEAVDAAVGDVAINGVVVDAEDATRFVEGADVVAEVEEAAEAGDAVAMGEVITTPMITMMSVRNMKFSKTRMSKPNFPTAKRRNLLSPKQMQIGMLRPP